MHVPVDVLARLGGDEFAWQVPALREELVTALIRSLPKDLRRNFVPAPDTARAVLAGIVTDSEPLLAALQRELHRRTGVLVPLDAFDLDKLPAHLRVTFAVEHAEGAEVARGKDLAALQEQLAAPVRAAVAAAVAGDLERTGLRRWPDDLDELPRTVERHQRGTRPCAATPRSSTAGAAVDVRVFATAGEQADAMRARHAAAAAARRAVAGQSRSSGRCDPRTRLVLGANPDGSLAALLDDCADAAVDALVAEPVWTREEFATLRDQVAKALASSTSAIVGRVGKVLAAAHEVQSALPASPPSTQADAIADIRGQMQQLLPPGFVTATGATRLSDLTRYLTAASAAPRSVAARHQRGPRADGARARGARRLRRTGGRAAGAP